MIRFSVGSERHERVHARGAPRGNDAGGHRDDREEESDADKRRGVVWRDDEKGGQSALLMKQAPASPMVTPMTSWMRPRRRMSHET